MPHKIKLLEKQKNKEALSEEKNWKSYPKFKSVSGLESFLNE